MPKKSVKVATVPPPKMTPEDDSPGAVLDALDQFLYACIITDYWPPAARARKELALLRFRFGLLSRTVDAFLGGGKKEDNGKT